MTSTNILLGIGKKYINCGEELEVEGLDLYIKQNKLFGLLFYSSVIPFKKQILEKCKLIFNSLNKDEDNIKYIICICEENEEDYNKSLNEFKALNCLVVPYDIKIIDFLIKSYNIINFPSFIIFDKKGNELAYLKKNDILNINKRIVAGWNNLYSVPNLYKTTTYTLGDKGNITEHSHLLIFCDTLMKNYSGSGWICDLCRKNFGAKVPSFHCAKCGFDVCDPCYEKYKY